MDSNCSVGGRRQPTIFSVPAEPASHPLLFPTVITARGSHQRVRHKNSPKRSSSDVLEDTIDLSQRSLAKMADPNTVQRKKKRPERQWKRGDGQFLLCVIY